MGWGGWEISGLVGSEREDGSAGRQPAPHSHKKRRHSLPPVTHALHLVRHQQDAVLVAQLAQAGHKTRGRHDIAALAQDRLQHDRRGLAGRRRLLEQLLDGLQRRAAAAAARWPGVALHAVRVGRLVEAGGQRAVVHAVHALGRGHGQGGERPAVEAALKVDDVLPAGLVPRQLHGGLHRLGARA